MAKTKTQKYDAEKRRRERKAALIKELAEYLAGTNQVMMSIKLETESEDAKQWLRIRSVSGLNGYPSVEEAEAELTRLLG